MTTFNLQSQDLSNWNDSEELVLQDQFGKSYTIDINQNTAYLLIFKGDQSIGTEGVKWTRAFEKQAEEVSYYPIMEMKKLWRALPRPIKKHIAINHLQGELKNPSIKGLEQDEHHPKFILDWKNETAQRLGRTTDEVWVLKIENGKIVDKAVGAFSEEKLTQFFDK